jgi:hypothetical protein
MPEYKCECCDFKTIDKGKYLKHNETIKHLKKMESYVKLEPVKQEPVIQEPDLKVKVLKLEQTIEMLIKRIEVLENNQVAKPAVSLPVVEPVVEQVVEPVVEQVVEPVVEPIGIDEIINHIEHETHIDFEPYTEHKEYGDVVKWDKYVKEHLDEDTHNEISNGNVVFELLKDTYDGNSEKAIFKKLCKLIPKETIKVKDISRGKFSIYCEGKWFNQVEATERLEKLINILQRNISNLHYIHITCQELYREVDYDNFIKLNEKVFEGNAIKKSIVKSILEYYQN